MRVGRAVIKSRGLGISSAYYECGPQLPYYENRRKIESKEIPSRLIPAYLWYLTWNLSDNPGTIG